tara:strand:+ start:2996 stop:3901 length:906 start_codon:yes stop_codon:yes gene_type:complete
MKSNQKVKIAVVPVAGLGSRMLPATKAIPKEMLPVFDKPLIQYVVEEIINAEFDEIIFVTHSSKNSIENHFDDNFYLEDISSKKNTRKNLSVISSKSNKSIKIISIRQSEAKGLGHAILCAKSLLKNEPFAVILPDRIFYPKEKGNNLKKMKDSFEINQTSKILLENVEPEDVSKFGIVKLNIKKNSKELNKIIDIVEKPEINQSPSNLAVLGRYIFNYSIFDYLEKISKNSSGEYELTDAIKKMIKHEHVQGIESKDTCFDCGDKLGYAKAFYSIALENNLVSKDLLEYLKNLVKFKSEK